MDGLKLKIKSKKLNSGKYQVNFSTEGIEQTYYGYLLAEPKTSLSEVIEAIAEEVKSKSIYTAAS